MSAIRQKYYILSWTIFKKLSQTHRMFKAGRDTWSSSGPPPPVQAGPSKARTMFKQFLNISKDGDCATPLGALCQRWVTLTVKRVFPDVQRDPPVFLPIVSGPVNGYHRKEPGSLVFIPSLYINVYIGKIFLGLLFPG